MNRPVLLSFLLAGLLLASCAAPASKLYTLGVPAIPPAATAANAGFPVIYIARVALPDYLDTEDILVRRGDVLDRSSTGRFATRLSLGATNLIAARLARRYPSALVSDQPPLDMPVKRLVVTVSRLDVAADGNASLVADWSIIPADPRAPSARQRASFVAQGPVATDENVVTLERRLLTQLADAIVLPPLSSGRLRTPCRRKTAAEPARSSDERRCRHKATALD